MEDAINLLNDELFDNNNSKNTDYLVGYFDALDKFKSELDKLWINT